MDLGNCPVECKIVPRDPRANVSFTELTLKTKNLYDLQESLKEKCYDNIFLIII